MVFNKKEYNKEYRKRPYVIEKKKDCDKKYREEHKEEIKEYQKEYHKRPEELAKKRERGKIYRKKNPDKIKEYRNRPEIKIRKKELDKEYRKKDYVIEKDKIRRQTPTFKSYKKEYDRGYERRDYVKEKYKIKYKEWRKKNPEKWKAHMYAYRHNQRKYFCEICGLCVPNLQFHHTNYEENKGVTVCVPCHKLLHNTPTSIQNRWRGGELEWCVPI